LKDWSPSPISQGRTAEIYTWDDHHVISHTAALSDDLKNKVFLMLEALPDRQNLCHGDYHPGNVLITRRGPLVIDWMTACAGSQSLGRCRPQQPDSFYWSQRRGQAGTSHRPARGTAISSHLFEPISSPSARYRKRTGSLEASHCCGTLE
jgi:hypothetical protein